MSRRQLAAPADVEVVTHGRLPERIVGYAREKILDLSRYTAEPILHVRIKLGYAADPAVPRPARAQANLDVDGRLLRGEVSAATLREAVDLLQARLRHRLSRMALHWQARRGGQPVPAPGEWRHGSPAGPRPDEAAFDLTGPPSLFLSDAASGRSRVPYHRYDGQYGLIRPAG